MKPDISAPGNIVAAANNSFYADFDRDLITDTIVQEDGGNWWYSIRRGTSMAAPHVAGIAALMLEANAELTPEEIKRILVSHAEQDNFTGTAANNIWGGGKVNAHQSLASLEQPTSVRSEDFSSDFHVFPNPSNGRFALHVAEDGPCIVRILNSAGQTILHHNLTLADKHFELDLTETQAGVYFVQLQTNGRTAQKMLIVLD